jgi:hypothetical protein
MTEKMMAAAVKLTGGKAMAAGPPNSYNSPSRPDPYRLARLSELIVCPDQRPGHAVPPALLHEQVSERKTRTGRNPRSI